MRRLTLAALFGAMLLSACSDDSRESPLEPNAGGPARVVEPTPIPCPPPRFPVVSIANQIKQVFRPGPLRVEALAREAIIAVLWTKCKPARAHEAVASFVGFTLRNFQAGKIGAGTPSTSTPAKVSDLIDAMLAAVLLSPQNLPLEDLGDADFGSGFADGVSTGRVTARSTSGTAGGSWQGNAWGEPSVVTFFRLPDDSESLETEGEEKFAPFWDYNVSNASNNHITVNGELFVGFCLEDFVDYPETVEIGHNPVQINGPLGEESGLPFFEILLRLTQTEYATLGLTICPNLQNIAPPPIGLKFGEGLPAFASSAWHTAAGYLAPFAQTILPGRVHAAAPKNTGVGGRTSSYSPFGVVEPISDFGTLMHLDPEYSSDTVLSTITRRVQLISGESSVPGVPVTFSTEDGTLGEGTPQIVETDEDGQAIVTWTLPADFPEVFTLTASVPGSTITFTVAAASHLGQLTPLSCGLEGTIRSLNSDTPVNMTFNNFLGEGQPSISVFWLNFSGLRELPGEGGGIGVPYAILEPGESYVQPTYVTHPWVLTSPGEPETCYGIFMPLSPGEGTFGGIATVQD